MGKNSEHLHGPKAASIEVEVAYALAERQVLLKLQVDKTCTALEAVKLSGILTQFPELDVDSIRMGIFSKALDGKHLPLPDAYVLEARDRVEIYRPLLIDPKEARMQRVIKERKAARRARNLQRKDVL